MHHSLHHILNYYTVNDCDPISQVNPQRKWDRRQERCWSITCSMAAVWTSSCRIRWDNSFCPVEWYCSVLTLTLSLLQHPIVFYINQCFLPTVDCPNGPCWREIRNPLWTHVSPHWNCNPCGFLDDQGMNQSGRYPYIVSCYKC